MTSLQVDPRAASWTGGHGRSPSLQLRHTVDDKLMIATQPAFLSLRSMLHRNLDSMILLSEEVQEKKIRRRDVSTPKSFVITNKHVYIIGLPGKELFAPASLGGCFQTSELSRVCSVTGSPHVILQFVNGVVALEASSVQASLRIVDVLFSASGVNCEFIEGSEFDNAAAGSSHFLRENIRFSISAPMNGSKSPTKVSSSRQSIGMGSEISSRGIDNVLRDILRGGEDEPQSARFVTVGVQTDTPQTLNIGVGAHPLCEERATSPIATYFETQRHESHTRDETSSERTNSTANSEFDTAEVWKSLRRVPPAPLAPRHTASVRLQPHSSSPKIHKPVATRPRDDEMQRRDEPPRKESPRQSLARISDKERNETTEPSQNPGGLEQFLGVLAVYIPSLVACGIDTPSKLVGLSESEIDRILDEAKIVKQGHRLLMHSKLSLQRGK